MPKVYDVFKEDQIGTPIWVENVDESQLKKRLLKLSYLKPGKYRVFDAEAGKFVEPPRKSA